MKKIVNAVCVLVILSTFIFVINGCKKTANLDNEINSNDQIIERIKLSAKDNPMSITIPINKKIEFVYLDKYGSIKTSSQMKTDAQSQSTTNSLSANCFQGNPDFYQLGVFESITRTNFVCGYSSPYESVVLTFKWKISTSENLSGASPSRGRVKGKNLNSNVFTFTTPNTPPTTNGIPVISPSSMTVVNTGVIDVDAPSYPDNYWWAVSFTITIPNYIFSDSHLYSCTPIIATDCPSFPFIQGIDPSVYSIGVDNVYSPVCERNDTVYCSSGNASSNAAPAIGGVNAVAGCYPSGYELPGAHHIKIYEGNTYISQEYISTTGVKSLPYLQVGHTYRVEYNNIKYSNFNPANLTTGILCETSIPTSSPLYYNL